MTYRYPLNSQDRFLLLENEMLQGRGLPGLQCQAHVWFDGRLDEGVLGRAVERMAERYPASTARLVRSPRIQDVHWVATPGGTIPVEVIHLDDDSDQAVLRLAEATLCRKIDLGREPPIWFMLLRRPTAGDVLVIPYSHVLMDGKAPEYMMLLLNGEEDGFPDGRTRSNEVEQWLSTYSRSRRILAMSRLMASVAFGRSRARASEENVLTVPQLEGPLLLGDGIGFHLRTLDAEAAARVRHRVRETIGLESLAPALVASAFRAVASLHPPDEDGVCRTYVPVTLRNAPGLRAPAFCNLSSVLTVARKREALADREALVREIQAEIRGQIRAGRDMAVAQTGWWLTRRRRPLAWRFVWRNQTWDTSFIFGYHGTIAPGLDRVLGVPVRRLYNVMSIANPPGISLSTNQTDGALNFAVTRVSGAVSAELTETFLDRLLEDLVA